MHIETTNYGHRWNNRRAAAATEPIPRPSSWSANSGKSRTTRKLPISHSHSVQSSSIPHTHAHVSHSLHEFSSLASAYPVDPLHETDFPRFPLGNGRCCHTELCEPTNPVESTHSHSLKQPFMDQTNLFSHRQQCDSDGPEPLPPHIVLKLKERFEKRVLHQHDRRNHRDRDPHKQYTQTEHALHSNPTARSRPEDNWIESKSSVLHSKSDKYQLVAAFLVNKGAVEAWHIYAPIPVNVGQNNDECVGTRMLELTQRRLRLIQRYYSGARQYVVLYVNSNYAEHYLPMGLAHDPESEEHCARKRTKRRESPHSDIFQTGHRLVNRIFSTVWRPQQRTASVTDSTGSNAAPVCESARSATVESVQSELNINDTAAESCLRRNKSLPPHSRSENQKRTKREEEFGPNSCLPSRSLSQTHRGSILRRIVEHIWTSYRRPSSSKSVNFVLHRKASSTGRNEYENTRSTGAISGTSEKLVNRKSHEDTHEKESSSSGLIDFSSSTGSTTSDQLAFSPSDVMVFSPTKQQTITTTIGCDVTEKRSQIWLPKEFKSK